MSLKNSNNLSSTANANAKRKKKDTKRETSGLVQTETQGNITAYSLTANGLTVLYARVKGSPTVTTAIVYNVGSRHEQTGETGLAHMLEHMLFKPTTGTGVKWKDLENKGAHLNASTWFDRTLYYFNLPKAYLGDMLAVEADRMRNVVLTEEEFLPERANVLSEYEMYNSRPEIALEWDILATAFQYHGYHHDTIGFRKDIEAYTIERLKSFYDKYYWPSNATLIIAGDVEEEELSREVLKHFQSIPQGTVPPKEQRVENEQNGVRRVTLVRPTPVRLMTVAFKAPAFSSADWLPLMLGFKFLISGETSPLYRRLVDTGLATDVSAHLYSTHDPFLGFLAINATKKGKYAQIEAVVFEEIKKTIDRQIPEKVLSLLREKLYTEELFSRDGSMAVAASLGEYVAAGDWKLYTKTLREISKVTSNEVTCVLKQYLTLHQATIGTLEQP